jgi:predicted anti-sigma-YlaC factor YlaD
MLDGDEPGIEPRLVDSHIASCPACGRYRATAQSSRRDIRLQPASGEMPDRSRRVVTINELGGSATRWTVLRGALGAVAVVIIAFALKALVLGEESHASTHAAHHLGAFSVAYGIGLLVVVVRPARARTMLPVAAVLAGALVITSAVDSLHGLVPLVSEIEHLPDLLSVVLVWLIGVPSPRRRAVFSDGALRRSSVPVLRAVRDAGHRPVERPARAAGD